MSPVIVLDRWALLWLEHAPFGNVPPRRDYIDRSVAAFQFLDNQNVLVLGTGGIVLGTGGNLWLEHPPWAHGPGGIPAREQIDSNVVGFQGIDAQNVLVLGGDQRLWLEYAPFGNVPPRRDYIDQSVAAFQFLDSQNVLVLGTDGNLWLMHPPWGPTGRHSPRDHIDSNVGAGFQGLDAQNVLVLGTDGNLWWEHAPFGNVPPNREQIDSDVADFQAVATTQLLRHVRAGGHLVNTRLQ